MRCQMTEQHECEWHFFEDSVDGMFCVKGCHGRLLREEAERRINEYETLKKATDMWTPDDARRLSNTCMSMQEKAIHGKEYLSLRESAIAYWKNRVVKLLAYADALEGK